MELFTEKDSIVRKIWGKSDTVLFIFAGASAEFALNKAVDWLYFTGKLPSDPLGRLFSTVGYAKKIVFAPADEAHKSIEIIRQIHMNVEQNRGASIPGWAYRDVLFMLVHYSIASYELLERKLTADEKEEVYNVFYRMGTRMGLKELPISYTAWLPVRESHLEDNLKASKYTFDLFKQYKKHLGLLRYEILIESQKLVVPKNVKKLLYLNDLSILILIIPIYKLSRLIHLDAFLKDILLPSQYKKEIRGLDVVN
ncbi:MAG: oxygenase MpaB family protein [Flavobacterium sp.]